MRSIHNAIKHEEKINQITSLGLIQSIKTLKKNPTQENLEVITSLVFAVFRLADDKSDFNPYLGKPKMKKLLGEKIVAKIQGFYPQFLADDSMIPFAIHLEARMMKENPEYLVEFSKENETVKLEAFYDATMQYDHNKMVEIQDSFCSYNKQLFSDGFYAWANRINSLKEK